MGKANTETSSLAGTVGKYPYYKTNSYHQSALRSKVSKGTRSFSLPIRRKRHHENGSYRTMDLLRTFYTLTQTSTITNDSLIFRLHTKATVVILVTLTIIVTTRQYVGNPIDCIHTRDIPEDVLNTFCWIHSTFTVVDAHKRIISDQAHYPGVLFTGSRPIKQVKYYQWVAFVLFFQEHLQAQYRKRKPQ